MDGGLKIVGWQKSRYVVIINQYSFLLTERYRSHKQANETLNPRFHSSRIGLIIYSASHYSYAVQHVLCVTSNGLGSICKVLTL